MRRLSEPGEPAAAPPVAAYLAHARHDFMRNRPAEATADGERLAEEAEPEVPPTGERASALVDASPGAQ